MMKAVQLRVLGGALGRVPNDATAFAHRDRRLFANIAAMYMDPGEKDAHDAWVAGLADALGKDGAGGYVGFLGEEDEETVRAAYPGGHLGPPPRAEAPLRPRQSLPPQPQHPTGPANMSRSSIS